MSQTRARLDRFRTRYAPAIDWRTVCVVTLKICVRTALLVIPSGAVPPPWPVHL